MFDLYALDDEYGTELHVANNREIKTFCGKSVEFLRDRESATNKLPSGTYCTECHLAATRKLARSVSKR